MISFAVGKILTFDAFPLAQAVRRPNASTVTFADVYDPAVTAVDGRLSVHALLTVFALI